MHIPTGKQVTDTDVMIRRGGPREMVQTISVEDFTSALRCAAWYRDVLAVARERIIELEKIVDNLE